MNKLRTMNPEQIAALLRTVFQFLGGVLGTWGYMNDAQWATFSGPLIALILAAWGTWARSDTNLIISAAGVPAVDKIVAPGTKPAVDPSIKKVQDAPLVGSRRAEGPPL